MTQRQLEERVIELLLAYGDETSGLLLAQAKQLTVKARDFTGVGFYTRFAAPEELKVQTINKRYEGVTVSLKRPDDTMFFILYIDEGYIHCLEGCAHGEWHEKDIHRIDPATFDGGGRSSFL